MQNTKLIGLKIKEIRKRKKISQEMLAEKIGMNPRSILRLENAQNIPTIETLDKIAKALDVNITDFFDNKIPNTKNDIISDINTLLNNMDFEELKKFYKSLYYYIN